MFVQMATTPLKELCSLYLKMIYIKFRFYLAHKARGPTNQILISIGEKDICFMISRVKKLANQLYYTIQKKTLE